MQLDLAKEKMDKKSREHKEALLKLKVKVENLKTAQEFAASSKDQNALDNIKMMMGEAKAKEQKLMEKQEGEKKLLEKEVKEKAEKVRASQYDRHEAIIARA